jgi:pimeloyl-ACP methyl ester carboxylesterase
MRKSYALRALAGLAVVAIAVAGLITPASAADRVGHESLSLDFGDFTAKAQLDYPTWRKNAPVVVLIPGSGPEDMNADVPGADRKPLSHIFLDLANSLTARGFAVMRYNKHYVTSPTEIDYASYYTKLDLPGMLRDAGTVLAAAKSNPHVNPHQVFLYGWSEGSTVAAALATAHPEVAGVIFQGPVTQTWPSLFRWQDLAVGVPYLRSYGSTVGPAELKAASTGNGGLVARQIVGSVAPNSYNGDFSIDPTLDLNHDGRIDVDHELAPSVPALVDKLITGPLKIYAVGRALPDVSQVAPTLRMPVLVLQGQNDANVPAAGALRLAGKDHVVRVYPGLGHSLGRTNSIVGDNFQPIAAQPQAELALWLLLHS